MFPNRGLHTKKNIKNKIKSSKKNQKRNVTQMDRIRKDGLGM